MLNKNDPLTLSEGSFALYEINSFNAYFQHEKPAVARIDPALARRPVTDGSVAKTKYRFLLNDVQKKLAPA